MKLQKHWYLGFIGLIGFYQLPTILEFFSSEGHWLDLTNLFWFVWFLYFIPETEEETS